jgi:glycosyltransferase involved in cell wall biosynthesis
MNRKVLFIAYHFPPIGGSGVQRSLKHVKYLPLFNYVPIVATVKNGHNFAYDFKMLSEIPKSVKVYRSNSGEKLWMRKIIEETTTKISKIKNFKNFTKSDSIIEENINSKSKSKIGLKERVFHYLEYNYYVPDTKIRWYKHAIKDIKNRILNENQIDIIYSTSSPYTDHLIALEIKKYTNKPWVADFRDPWIGNKFIYDRYDEKRQKKELEMEYEVVKNADIIIQVTESIAKEYRERYPEYAEKIVVITNGFDLEDLGGVKKAAVSETKFSIRYTGMFVEGQNIEIFIKALEELGLEIKNFKKDLLVEFTGFVPEEHRRIISNSIIKEKVIINDYVTHNKALELMNSSNINLVILPNEEASKGIYTGKIFDCILVERPILAIMPTDGVAAKLICENDIGTAVEMSDLEGMKRFIRSEYEKFVNGIDVNTGAITKCGDFERKNITKALVGYFDILLN